MSNISQYLADNANAGACAANYYGNTHDTATCRLAAGVCSVIAYLITELKNAEQRERMALQAQPLPAPQYVSPAPVPLSPVPLSPVPGSALPLVNPCKAGNADGTGDTTLGHSSGLTTWLNEGVERRRS